VIRQLQILDDRTPIHDIRRQSAALDGDDVDLAAVWQFTEYIHGLDPSCRGSVAL
jgi:hypothetical protein